MTSLQWLDAHVHALGCPESDSTCLKCAFVPSLSLSSRIVIGHTHCVCLVTLRAVCFSNQSAGLCSSSLLKTRKHMLAGAGCDPAVLVAPSLMRHEASNIAWPATFSPARVMYAVSSLTNTMQLQASCALMHELHVVSSVGSSWEKTPCTDPWGRVCIFVQSWSCHQWLHLWQNSVICGSATPLSSSVRCNDALWCYWQSNVCKRGLLLLKRGRANGSLPQNCAVSALIQSRAVIGACSQSFFRLVTAVHTHSPELSQWQPNLTS